MRFCQPHWDRLKEAIDAEGIGHLVARDGQAAVANMVSELETGSRRENFDPLMGAHWAIVNRIADVDPRVLLIEGCPLCWAADEHEQWCTVEGCQVTRQTFEDWIPDVAGFMREQHERMVAAEKDRLMTMDWQIMICSVWARTGYLQPLLEHLSRQAELYEGRVQVLVDRDNGEESVGVKRTRLLEAATADYVCFVDDDDWVSDDYVGRIMIALCDLPDAVGFRLAYSRDGILQKPAIHSSRFDHWDEDADSFYRTINHLNPVRRSLALRCLPFQDGFGEDHAYADRLAPFLRSEVFLDGGPVYEYRYSRTGSLFAGASRAVRADPGLEVPAYVHLLSDHVVVNG